MTPKERFQKNGELHRNLSSVVSSDWFEECLIYATADLLDSKITEQQLEGARMFKAKLLGLCEGADLMQFPVSGLQHRIEPSRKVKEPVETQKAK